MPAIIPLVDSTLLYYKKRIETLFSIVNEHGETVPFLLREPQMKILESLTRRDVILKARQEGISSLVLAMYAVDFIFVENMRCAVISHEKEATVKLLEKVRFFLNSAKKNHPDVALFDLEYDSKYLLTNKMKNATFYIGTAGAKAFGRGDTLFDLHISELAFWENQEVVMTGLLQAVPLNGRVMIESTANGVGDYFHNLWLKSQSPQSTFKPHFLAWFDDKKYTLPIIDGFTPSQEEQELAQTHNLSHEQLNWRRWKLSELSDDVDRFNQEYPATDTEAFIVSGNPIWPPTLLKKLLNRCKPPKRIGNLYGAYEVYFEDNDKGYVKLWKEPIPGHSYVIGADVAEGIEVPTDGPKSERRDYSVAYVLDRNSAELVACWHGHIDGDQYGRQLEMLGRYYHGGVIGVERNFQGLAPLIMLRDLNYSRIYFREKLGTLGEPMTAEMGWKTDRFTRPMMIDEFSKWLREDRLTIYDKDLVSEMMSFVRYPDGQGRAASNAFDDRVISVMITLQMYVRNPTTEIGNPIEQSDDQLTSEDSGLPLDLDLGGADSLL